MKNKKNKSGDQLEINTTLVHKDPKKNLETISKNEDSKKDKKLIVKLLNDYPLVNPSKKMIH